MKILDETFKQWWHLVLKVWFFKIIYFITIQYDITMDLNLKFWIKRWESGQYQNIFLSNAFYINRVKIISKIIF